MLQRLAIGKSPCQYLSLFPIEHALPQYGIELFQFEAIGMILSIFFRMIKVRTLRTFHSNIYAATLSLSHIYLQYLLLLATNTRRGKKLKYTVLPL